MDKTIYLVESRFEEWDDINNNNNDQKLHAGYENDDDKVKTQYSINHDEVNDDKNDKNGRNIYIFDHGEQWQYHVKHNKNGADKENEI